MKDSHGEYAASKSTGRQSQDVAHPLPPAVRAHAQFVFEHLRFGRHVHTLRRARPL